MQELGIYVHIPFCVQKCLYCDFVSYANKEDKINEYIQALIKEIQLIGAGFWPVPITSIYIGGGTPSCIASKYIEEIINAIKKNFNVTGNVEITIEVNPRYCNKGKITKIY